MNLSKLFEGFPVRGFNGELKVSEEIWAMVANFSLMATTVDLVACYQEALSK